MYLTAELTIKNSTGYDDAGEQLPPEVTLTVLDVDTEPETRKETADLTDDEPVDVYVKAAYQLAEWGYESTSPWTDDEIDGSVRSCDLEVTR